MLNVKLCAFADEAGDTLPEQIAMMKDNGIGYLELRAIDKKNVSKMTVAEITEYKKRLDDAGIKVWSLGSPIGKVDINAPFEQELDRLKHTVELAVAAEAQCIRLFSFYGTNGDPAYRDAVIENLSKFVEAAKGSGVTLCHENEKGIYGDNAARCLEIHKAIPEMPAIFDPANFVQVGQNTLEAWEMLEPYVYYGHIKDSLADGSIVPAGAGEGHIAEYLPKFFAKGCEVLTLEPHLAIFSSLAAIEKKGDESKIGHFHFDSKREAFDLAVNELKKIIRGIEA